MMKLRKLHKKRIRVVKIDNRNIVNQLLDIINNGVCDDRFKVK